MMLSAAFAQQAQQLALATQLQVHLRQIGEDAQGQVLFAAIEKDVGGIKEEGRAAGVRQRLRERRAPRRVA